MSESTEKNLSVARNIKIGFFHLGSGMADIMTTGVWNRIMISDLGFAATPVSLLVSLRYFLAPLGVWAGRVSDERRVGGFQRLFWIWLGRALMVLSVFALGTTTTTLARGAEATPIIWLMLTLALLTFSLGNALSGSTFLALIYDRAAPHQRGRAVGIVWTFLLLGFTVGGILFGILLPSAESSEMLAFGGAALTSMLPFAHLLNIGGLSFTPDTLQNLFIVAGLMLGMLWFVSLLGEEKRSREALIQESGETDAPSTSLMEDLRMVWRSRPMRFFAIYLGFSMAFAFSQDAVLEPFAGDVFGMDARITTKFAAYWGSMSILGTLVFLWLSHRIKRLTNTRVSFMGVVILIATFVLLTVCAVFEIRGLVTISLIALGLGLGVWNVGTLGLMMDMSPLERAGTFLGFWTLVVTLSRGFGVSSGGIIRDIALQLTGSLNSAYAAVFILGTAGLLVSAWALRKSATAAPQTRLEPQPDTATILAGAMD